MQINQILETINAWVWGTPLLILLLAVGLLLTWRTRGVQVRYLWYAHKLAFTRHDDKASGDISHFQALMTALAATIGIGSITGVATAIALGGLGSIFWMWVAAFFGMATKYAEAILAIKYRTVDEFGEMCGGPMFYLEKGLKSKFLGVLFAVLATASAFGIGNIVQANSVAEALHDLAGIPSIWTGIILMIATGVTLVGGIKSIGKMVGVLVPAMGLFYILGGLFIIAMRFEQIPFVFGQIIETAFHPKAALGGAAGVTLMYIIQIGVSRGIFSSEAGLGSSPIAAAAAKTDTPARQALVSMSSVFITTGIVCTITGLVIGVSGIDVTSTSSALLALSAFDLILPGSGIIVTIALIPFAYSTILGWAYYGEKCMEYLCGAKFNKYFRLLFALAVLGGSVMSLEFVWGVANIMNGLMAFPNLIGLFFLSKTVEKETKAFDKMHKGEA